MKKLFILFALLAVVMTLSGCSSLCVGSSCVEGEGSNVDIDTTILPYMHINGEGTEVEREGVLLFEYESSKFVKYQYSYLSCTCRPDKDNYWQVMYIEVEKGTGAVQKISFNAVDPTVEHVYTAGLWGDSSPTPGPSQDYSDGKYYADFEADYIPWLVGKTLVDLQGISVFKNTSVEPYHGIVNDTDPVGADDLMDSFAGSSVSTNNMLRAVKVVLEYHGENY